MKKAISIKIYFFFKYVPGSSRLDQWRTQGERERVLVQKGILKNLCYKGRVGRSMQKKGAFEKLCAIKGMHEIGV